MKTILVLDDEFNLLNLVCRLLQRHGYRTLQTCSTGETLRIFQDGNCQVDLFIVDVCLPGASGIQVAVDLRTDLPDLPILLVSGYPQHSWSKLDSALLEKLGLHFVSILQKPFTPQSLLTKVGELIGGTQSKSASSA
jgi:two-component system, cell cycle sensor histidine kinase and response regulator CckA